MSQLRKFFTSPTSWVMFGLLLALYIAILANFPGYLIQIIGFVLLSWSALVIISGIKLLLNPDFVAFEDEMDINGLTSSGQVQVSRIPSGTADIENDANFLISYDGKHWSVFTAAVGVYNFRNSVISRKSVSRKDIRLAYYKKAKAYFVYEEK